MIDIEDHTDLAWYFANSSNKKHLQGVELEDLYQSALIGIWLASLQYDDSLGSFSNFAYKYIQGEITNLVYKQATEDGKSVRVERVAEILLGDMDSDEDCIDQDTYEDDILDIEFIEEYLSTLPLREDYKPYFYNLITHGDREATRLYIEDKGFSRQRAYQVKKHIRDVAKRHMERLEEC